MLREKKGAASLESHLVCGLKCRKSDMYESGSLSMATVSSTLGRLNFLGILLHHEQQRKARHLTLRVATRCAPLQHAMQCHHRDDVGPRLSPLSGAEARTFLRLTTFQPFPFHSSQYSMSARRILVIAGSDSSGGAYASLPCPQFGVELLTSNN